MIVRMEEEFMQCHKCKEKVVPGSLSRFTCRCLRCGRIYCARCFFRRENQDEFYGGTCRQCCINLIENMQVTSSDNVR